MREEGFMSAAGQGAGTTTPPAKPHARVEWIDLAKAVAIVAIIVGHFTAFFLSLSPESDAAFRLMDTFHVPLFFLLSGYCMSGPLDKRRALRLLRRCGLPYLFCGIACLLVCAVAIDGFQPEAHVFGFLYGAGAYRGQILFGDPAVVQSIGVLWFLPCLLFGQLFASLCLRAERLAPWLPPLLALGLFMVGATTAGMLFLPLDVQPGLCAAWFICCGYLLKRQDAFRPGVPLRLMQAGGVLYMALVVAGPLEEAMYCNATYHQPLIDAIGCACAAVLVASLSKGLERLPRRAERAVSWIGRNTLAIFCFHAITLATGDHLKWRLLELVSAGVSLPLVLIGSLALDLLVSIACAWAVRYVPGVRAIFGYGPRIRADAPSAPHDAGT